MSTHVRGERRSRRSARPRRRAARMPGGTTAVSIERTRATGRPAGGLLPLRPVPGGWPLGGVRGRVRRAGQPGGVVLLGRGGGRGVAGGLAVAGDVLDPPAARRGGCRRAVSRPASPLGGGARRRRRGSTCPQDVLRGRSRAVVCQSGLPRRRRGLLRPAGRLGRDRALHAAGDGRGLERGPQVRAVVPGGAPGAGRARRRPARCRPRRCEPVLDAPPPTPAAVAAIEEVTQHDVIAFLYRLGRQHHARGRPPRTSTSA